MWPSMFLPLNISAKNMCFQLDVARDQSNKTHIPILHLMTQTGDLRAIKNFPKCGPWATGEVPQGLQVIHGCWRFPRKKDGMILLIHLKCKIKIFHSHPLLFLITVTFFNTARATGSNLVDLSWQFVSGDMFFKSFMGFW